MVKTNNTLRIPPFLLINPPLILWMQNVIKTAYIFFDCFWHCRNYTFPPYQPQSHRIPISYSANRPLIAWLLGHIRIKLESTGDILVLWILFLLKIYKNNCQVSLKSLEDKIQFLLFWWNSFAGQQRPVSTNRSPFFPSSYKDKLRLDKAFLFYTKINSSSNKAFWWISPTDFQLFTCCGHWPLVNIIQHWSRLS